MWYAIISDDQPNSLKNRQKHRTAHLARLQQLQDEGRLLIAGAHPMIDSETAGSSGHSGSLVVAEFSSLNAAQTWADEDPFNTGGVYFKVVVKPFKKVFPS